MSPFVNGIGSDTSTKFLSKLEFAIRKPFRRIAISMTKKVTPVINVKWCLAYSDDAELFYSMPYKWRKYFGMIFDDPASPCDMAAVPQPSGLREHCNIIEKNNS